MNQKTPQDKERDKRRMEVEDLRAVATLPHGARFLWRLLGDCRVFQLSYNQSGSQTMFHEGMRNVGLKLMSDLAEAVPNFIPDMMLKQNKENG